MSEHYQRIIDVKVSPEEADSLAKDVLNKLINAGIVSASPTDCTSSREGYPPGTNVGKVVDWDPIRLQTMWHGLEINVGKIIDYSRSEEELLCEKCNGRFEIKDELLYAYLDAFFAARNNQDSNAKNSMLSCPGCNHSNHISNWKHEPAVAKMMCEQCGAQSEFDDAWSTAVDEWYCGTGEGLLQCSACQHSKPVTEWTYDPEWGFGYLSFTFWNWPPLYKKFIEEIGEMLGHRIVFISAKL